MKRYAVIFVFLVCLSLLAVSSVRASMVTYPSLGTYVEEAYDIIIGQVVAIECKKGPTDEFAHIYVTIRIEKNLKKQLLSKEITICHYGNVIPPLKCGTTYDVYFESDQPVFKKNERVLIFISPHTSRTDSYDIYGKVGGKYSVINNMVINTHMSINKSLDVFLAEIEGFLNEKKK